MLNCINYKHEDYLKNLELNKTCLCVVRTKKISPILVSVLYPRCFSVDLEIGSLNMINNTEKSNKKIKKKIFTVIPVFASQRNIEDYFYPL